MSVLGFFGLLVLMVLIPVAPFVIARWVRWVVDVYHAVDVLQRERRASESLAKTAEALAVDAHEWRGSEDDAIGCAGDVFDENEEPGLAPAVKRMKAERETSRETMDRVVGYAVAQPPPQNSSDPALWPLIISELGESETDRLVAADMLTRHEFGVAKYGVPLVASNGRDHLADAYQEALDGVVYLRAADERLSDAIAEREVLQEDIAMHERVWQCYTDMLDLAKEIREMIRERDGR